MYETRIRVTRRPWNWEGFRYFKGHNIRRGSYARRHYLSLLLPGLALYFFFSGKRQYVQEEAASE